MINFHFLGEEYNYKHRRNAIKKIMSLKNCSEGDADAYLENPFYNTGDMGFFFNNKLKELEEEEQLIQDREAQLDKYEPFIKLIQEKTLELQKRKLDCQAREEKIKAFMNQPNVEITIEKEEEEREEPIEEQIEKQKTYEPDLISSSSEEDEPPQQIEQIEQEEPQQQEEQEGEPDSIVYVVGLMENEIEIIDQNEDCGYVCATDDIGEEIDEGDIIGEWEHIQINPKERRDNNCDDEGYLINKDIDSSSSFQKRIKLIRIHSELYKNLGENVYFRDNPYWCEFNISNKEMIDAENFVENYEGFLFPSKVCKRLC